MLKLNLGIVAACGLVAVACGSADLSEGTKSSESTGSDASDIVRGTTENGRNYVMNIRFAYNSINTQTGQQLTGNCSGILYAPRTVLTAGHCINPIRNAGTPQQFTDSAQRALVYIGNNYQADLDALTAAAGPGNIPDSAVIPPPAASRWMRADSWETHPSWDPAGTLYADLAVIYLDREPHLPPNNTKVDPLPIGRTRLGSSYVGLPFTIVGYGANVAFSEDIQQNAGSGVKRTGTSPFVGAPVTNPLPPHPHPGLGNPTVVNSLFQLNGTAPNANGCAGDSGGPAIRNVNGQDYVWGVGTWTGDFCEKFAYYTRFDGFLPFLDNGYLKGGQATTIPRLECVATRPGSSGLRAYYSYTNQNGVNVNVPYGTNNQFTADTANARPTQFKPGNHPYVFGVNFSSGQTITWKLSPTNSPTTTLTVNASSPRCAATSLPTACAQSCDASVAACPGSQSFEDCATFCRSWETDVGICTQEYANYNLCLGTQPTSSFTCDPDFGGFPNEGVCQAEIDALNACFGG